MNRKDQGGFDAVTAVVLLVTGASFGMLIVVFIVGLAVKAGRTLGWWA